MDGIPVKDLTAEAVCEWDSEEVRFISATLGYAQEGWLSGRERELIDTRTELLVFAKAHDVLANSGLSQGKKDTEQLRDIVSAVNEVCEEGAKLQEREGE